MGAPSDLICSVEVYAPNGDVKGRYEFSTDAEAIALCETTPYASISVYDQTGWRVAPDRIFSPKHLAAQLHLAWGSQPACGKVGLPVTLDAARVTCERCLAFVRRAGQEGVTI